MDMCTSPGRRSKGRHAPEPVVVEHVIFGGLYSVRLR